MIKKLTIFSFIAALALSMALSASAISVSPPIIEINARRGDVITEKIRITNDSDTEKTYYFSAELFRAEGEQGGSTFFVTEDQNQLSNWINFPIASLTLQPEERKILPFTIAIPTTADPGGHFASVFVGTQAPEAGDKSGVGVAGRVGSLLLVRVEGNLNENARIIDFATERSTINALPANFGVRVENLGNVHIKPRGNITVSNMFGGISAIVDVNTTGGNVLPDSVREFTASWVKDPSTVSGGNAGFWAKYRQEKNNLAFGRYTADLNLTYGENGETISATTSFFIFPWRYLLIKLVWLIIIIVVLVFLIKRYNAWIIKKAMNTPVAAKKKK